jgi:CHC2 zinc finger
MTTPAKKATRAEVGAALAELDAAAPVVSIADRERAKHLAQTKQRRQDLSDDALLLECLFDLFDFDADERGYMQTVVARSLGKAPEQKILVNEIELGRQLKGDSDVLEGSFKKRARRMFAQVDAKQRAVGRLALKRKPGEMIVAAGKEAGTSKRFAARGQKQLISAEYYAPIIQAVVDGVDAARPGHERRMIRFRRAARLVFDSLPECKPLAPVKVVTPFVRSAEDGAAEVSPEETFERVTGEASPGRPTPVPASAGDKRPRPLKRFKDNAALALRIARERDVRKGDGSTDEFNRQAALLQVELSRTIAEAQTGGPVDTATAIRETIALLEAMLEKPETLSTIVANSSDTDVATKSIVDSAGESAEVLHFSDPEIQKSQQKGTLGPQRLDKSVQAKRPGGRIPDEVVERVRRDADLVRVVESRGVKLTRAGSQYKGLCPFHDEKTPSFFVSPSKGLYHCQGCQSGGNVFNFVADLDRVGFRDALQIVAGVCSIPLPDEVFAPQPKAARAPRELTVERDPDPPEGFEVYDV